MRIIKLTESDLTRIIKRVIKEQEDVSDRELPLDVKEFAPFNTNTYDAANPKAGSLGGFRIDKIRFLDDKLYMNYNVLGQEKEQDPRGLQCTFDCKIKQLRDLNGEPYKYRGYKVILPKKATEYLEKFCKNNYQTKSNTEK
jgi:hypothetical protein